MSADAEGMTASLLRLLVVLVFVAAVAAGCGSSSSTPPSQPAPKVSAALLAQDQVIKMVLADGDLSGFSVHSTGGETLKDQLPSPASPSTARAGRRSRISSRRSARPGMRRSCAP